MFEHGKNKDKYYSIREKINYYQKVIKGTVVASAKTKRKAKTRLKTLMKLNERRFEEPTLIVTDDKHFGDGISKPRLAVVVDTDPKKGKLYVASVNQRTSKAIILDNQIDRQIDERKKWIDRSDVYETKYIKGVKPLTRYDKRKIIEIARKK